MPQNLLIRFSLFLLPVLLLLGGLEYVQRQLPNNYTHKREMLEKGLDQWETLILGSSHAYLGIDPAQFDGPTFNLAFTAQTLAYDKFLLEKYLDSLPKLERVILSISYGSLGAESYKNPGVYDKTYYYTQFWESELFTDWWKIEKYSRVGLFSVKRSVDRTRTYYTQGDSLLECRKDGFYGLEFHRDLEVNGLESATFHEMFYFDELRATNLGYLNDIIEMCKQKGVNLHFVSTPMWPSYMQHLDRSRYTYMTEVMDSISRTNHLSYWDLTEDSTFEEKDFYDANHLSEEGALKLTNRLKDWILHKENPISSVSSAEVSSPYDLRE